MSLKTTFCFLSICIFISSCSLIGIENNEYSHNYIYIYSAEEDITYTGAWFSFQGGGGSTIIEEDEMISVNGTELERGFESVLYDINEEHGHDFVGKIEDVEFQFTPLNGKDLLMSFTYQSTLVTEIPALPATIDNSPFEIEWVGEPLKDEETLTAEIYDGYNRNEVILIYEEGATSITIPSSILNLAHSGDIISITLVRHSDDEFKTDHEGSISYSYISKTATTELE